MAANRSRVAVGPREGLLRSWQTVSSRRVCHCGDVRKGRNEPRVNGSKPGFARFTGGCYIIDVRVRMNHSDSRRHVGEFISLHSTSRAHLRSAYVLT